MLDFIIFSSGSRDIIDYIDIFMPAIVGIFAIIFAYFANKINKDAIQQQHEEFETQLSLQKEQFGAQMKAQLNQWKYDVVVRNEIETIAYMRTLFFEAREAIHFFMWEFLSPFDGFQHYFHNAIDAPYKRDTFINCWQKLQRINVHLNKNLIIFQKYHLASKIQLVRAILALNIYLTDNDFEKIFVDESLSIVESDSGFDNKKFYKLKDEDIFKKAFASEANKILVTLDIADYKNILDDDLLKNYNIIWGKVLNILNNIEADINKILFVYEEIDIPTNEKIGIHNFYLNNK